MDLQLDDNQQLFHDTTLRFIETELPVEVTRRLHEDPRGYEDEWLHKAAEVGWFAMLVPEEHGGGSVSGQPLRDAAIIAELIGRFVQPGPFIPMNVVADALAEHGSPEQQALLGDIAAAQTVVTWAPYDGCGYWDLGAGLIATRLEDGFVLNGSRGLVQDAQTAHLVLVTANLDGSPIQLLVPSDAPGLDIKPLTCLDLTRRAADLEFDDVRLPGSAVLAAPEVVSALERQLQVAIALSCAETVGALDAMFSMTVAYAKDRVAFGRPIGAFQALKHVMADVGLWLEACKAGAVELAGLVDARAEEAAQATAMVAAYVGEHATEIAQQCLQIHGGIGCTWEHDLHLLMRRTRSNSAIYGDPAWHRERLCASYELGQSA